MSLNIERYCMPLDNWDNYRLL